MNTQTTTTETGLSRRDVQAIRRATKVHAQLIDGEHRLTCVKERTGAERERDPFLEDQRYEIAVEGRATDYERDGARELVAFETVSDNVSLGFREGDRLRLRWIRGNSSPLLLEHGLVLDELHLEIVRRADEHGRRPLRLMVEARACERHSLARMIRPRANL